MDLNKKVHSFVTASWHKRALKLFLKNILKKMLKLLLKGLKGLDLRKERITVI